MNENRSLRSETYRQSYEMKRIGLRAVEKAQEESRKLQIPNVYSVEGRLVYELPDGRITTRDPFAYPASPRKGQRPIQ